MSNTYSRFVFGLSMLSAYWACTANADIPKSMVFAKIPAGSFYMGSPLTEEWRKECVSEGGVERPYCPEFLHPVTCAAFEMQTTPVTNQQWLEVMGNLHESLLPDGAWCNDRETSPFNSKDSFCPNNPVNTITFEEAQHFVARMNEKKDGYKYRLPLSAEWEHAVRAGTQTAYFWGDDFSLSDHFVYNSTGPSRPVGKTRSNHFGLFDMVGGLYQWTADNPVSKWDLPILGQAQVYHCNAPHEAQSMYRDNRVLRGGSPGHGPWVSARSAAMFFWKEKPTIDSARERKAYAHFGFRLVRTKVKTGG